MNRLKISSLQLLPEKRKREVGLVVQAKYVALTKSKTFANVLKEKLEEKKKNNPPRGLIREGGLFGSGGLIDH